MYDDEKNPKLYLVESEVPRVKTYLGLRKARSEQESAVWYHTLKLYLSVAHLSSVLVLYFTILYF